MTDYRLAVFRNLEPDQDPVEELAELKHHADMVEKWFWSVCPQWDLEVRAFVLQADCNNNPPAGGGDWCKAAVTEYMEGNPEFEDWQPTHHCVVGGQSYRDNCGFADAGRKEWCAVYNEYGCVVNRVCTHEFCHLLVSSQHSGTQDGEQFLPTGDTTCILGMNKGGNLHFKTRHRGKPFETTETRGFVEITVSDDGPGIPAEIKSRIFEPFVSSKGGAHSGLGLSVVLNLINGLNGSIVCQSEEGRGTRFMLELPVVT